MLHEHRFFFVASKTIVFALSCVYGRSLFTVYITNVISPTPSMPAPPCCAAAAPEFVCGPRPPLPPCPHNRPRRLSPTSTPPYGPAAVTVSFCVPLPGLPLCRHPRPRRLCPTSRPPCSSATVPVTVGKRRRPLQLHAKSGSASSAGAPHNSTPSRWPAVAPVFVGRPRNPLLFHAKRAPTAGRSGFPRL